MTNIATPLPAAIAATNVPPEMNFNMVINEPIPIGSIVWVLSLILVPICTGLFVDCCIRARRKKALSWQPTFFSLAALTITTTTLVLISNSLKDVYYYTATSAWGVAQEAMYRMALFRACWTFSTGISASAICLVLAIISRRLKEKQEDR